ncbi:hypothetical protein CFP56_040633 [Quercus suber]|uniref:Uncharacterized protein n=1 Tax=Quercus suber TaxID=58331 RepID=A0AAW0IXT3_QUESU
MPVLKRFVFSSASVEALKDPPLLQVKYCFSHILNHLEDSDGPHWDDLGILLDCFFFSRQIGRNPSENSLKAFSISTLR